MASKIATLRSRLLFRFLPTTVRVLALLLGLVASRSAHAESAQPTQFLIGLIPEMNVFQQMERFTPLAAYLSRETGIEFKLTVLSRYGNIIDKFESLKLDGAFFGSFTGAVAIEKLRVIPVARPVNLDGESTYFGVLFAKKGSGIHSAQDMKGKRFAFVEKATTAGYVFPLAYFHEYGVDDLDAYFSETYFAGSHDATILDVYNGQADVGAAKNTVFERVMKARPEISQSLDILATSSRVPSNGLCLRRGIPSELREQIKQLLLNLDRSTAGQDVLKQLDVLRFVETSPNDYAPVRSLAEKAHISLQDYSWLNQ